MVSLYFVCVCAAAAFCFHVNFYIQQKQIILISLFFLNRGVDGIHNNNNARVAIIPSISVVHSRAFSNSPCAAWRLQFISYIYRTLASLFKTTQIKNDNEMASTIWLLLWKHVHKLSGISHVPHVQYGRWQ